MFVLFMYWSNNEPRMAETAIQGNINCNSDVDAEVSIQTPQSQNDKQRGQLVIFCINAKTGCLGNLEMMV